MRTQELKEKLTAILAQEEQILGIGQTGNIEETLVPGKSDIDMFVLCAEIPSREERLQWYDTLQEYDFTLQMEVCNGGLWGTGDILVVDEIDVMPMYFTVDEMRNYLEEVLQCKHLEKDGRFYPVGRLASVASIHILHEKKNTWTNLKDMVNEKPISFFKTWFENEIGQVLDEEDLGRAELRKEVLFYHQVSEAAIDRLLQALFAVNGCYFPSRKRTLSAIESFAYKPERCGERLLAVVENGARESTITASITQLRRLTQEIHALGANRFTTF